MPTGETTMRRRIPAPTQCRGTISKITAPLHQLPDAQDHVASNQKKRVKSAEKTAKKLFKAARS
jgi:hypothetical protein